MRHRQIISLLLTTLFVVIVSVQPAFAKLKANAGPDQNIPEGSLVTLDGTGSQSTGRELIAFFWEQTAGPAVALSGPFTAQPTFTAPEVSGSVELRFRLTVADAGAETDTDSVTIHVLDLTAANQPPTANAGSDQQVRSGVTVQLDGSGSFDPNGDPMVFAWTQVAGPPATLSNPSAVAPTFVAPAVEDGNDLIFRLTVSDGRGGVAQDDMAVRISPPVDPTHAADAGPDQKVESGGAVTLDGSHSADPGGTVTFQWTQVGGPPVPLIDADRAVARFVAPVVSEKTELTFRLTVTGASGSSSDDVAILVVPVAAAAERPIASVSALSVFPNPFDPNEGQATIEYDLGADSDVTISISDLFGRLVRELKLTRGSDGSLSGHNRAVWDGRNGNGEKTANGGYVVRISATDADGNSAHAASRLAVVR